MVFEQLTGEAAKHNWRVMLVGGQGGVAQKAAEHFVQRASQQGNKLTICAETGPWLDKTGEPTSQHEARVEQATIGKINKFKPHLLFVAFGLPKQEIWLSKHMNRLNVRVAMVVGGSFDYAAGNVPIPPEGVSRAGFEWLWRLLTQPWRAKRIATALLVFPWLVFLSKLHQKTN
ncbi:MAG: WecB/TagA/CpsF family glycosyltransferase [Candidatus Sungbacteria bacterium]|nr:WecB/TagA/CpsF family glycosyltransferase [Candidatus Sungbacteria bacterium]